MKYLIPILSLFVLISCSTNTNTDKQKAAVIIKKKRTPPAPKPEIPVNINYDSLDVSIKNQIKTLDSIYGRTPYYTVIDNKKMFIVLKGKFNPDSSYYIKMFVGRFKYGIFGEDLKPILPCNYDKVYNPNLTILNCMEIKKDNKVGLINFITHEILEPQFEYIMPSSKTPDNIAYGFKDKNWYKIESNKKFKILQTYFSPIDILKTLSFNELEVKVNLLYDCYNYYGKDEPHSGIGVVLTPSYIEHLNIMPEICDGLILPQQNGFSYGISEMKIKTDTSKSITDKIISFIVSFYQSGTSGRGFAEDTKELIVYDKERKDFHSKILNHSYSNIGPCNMESYKFINDSLIEVREGNEMNNNKKGRYDFETFYLYKVITKEGEIEDLECNRFYNFTKYVEINEDYFKGCFGKMMTESEMNDTTNIWLSEHLTLDDLDVMVNEIYAELGLKFKTEKWKDYFSQFDWYKPQYDNVDNKLSKIDKKNIETIIKEKLRMKGKENDYVKKHKGVYWAAG